MKSAYFLPPASSSLFPTNFTFISKQESLSSIFWKFLKTPYTNSEQPMYLEELLGLVNCMASPPPTHPSLRLSLKKIKVTQILAARIPDRKQSEMFLFEFSLCFQDNTSKVHLLKVGWLI